MCAMIPMFRVFSRENLRGIRSVSAGGGGGGCGQKERATRARAHDRGCPWTSRYVLEVSIPWQKATRGGAQVSSAARGNAGDDSKGFAPGPSAQEPPSQRPTGRRFAPGPSAQEPPSQRPTGRRFAPGPSAVPTTFALRSGLALAGLAGALLLLAATFATIIQITVGTSTKAVGADTSHSGWDRHGPALIVLALLAMWLLVLALRGSRAAMAGLAATGVAALAIAMIWDRPHVHDTGSVGRHLRRGPRGPGLGLLPRDAGRGAPAAVGRLAAGARAGVRPCTATAALWGGRRRVLIAAPPAAVRGARYQR